MASILGAIGHEWLVAIAAVATAFFTATLWWSTRKLWEATRNTALVQERDTKIIQRAYLSVEPRGVSTDVDSKGGPVEGQVIAHIGVHNAGNLPARNVSLYINTEFSLDKDWSEERLSKRDDPTAVGPFGNYVVQPAATMNQGGPTRSFSKIGYVYVWGEITYHDGFEAGRKTKFCHRYNCKRVVDLDKGMPWIKPKYGRHYERGHDAT